METSISLTRDAWRGDRIRDFLVILDGQEIGRIADGGSKTFIVPPGEHELRLKIDWCGSKTLKISLRAGERVALRCGSSLRGFRLLLALFYITVGRNRYLWLEEDDSDDPFQQALGV
jgi:hypothetical protein